MSSQRKVLEDRERCINNLRLSLPPGHPKDRGVNTSAAAASTRNPQEQSANKKLREKLIRGSLENVSRPELAIEESNLRRTRSLAISREDIFNKLEDPTFLNRPRRSQLIPRARLIERRDRCSQIGKSYESLPFNDKTYSRKPSLPLHVSGSTRSLICTPIAEQQKEPQRKFKLGNKTTESINQGKNFGRSSSYEHIYDVELSLPNYYPDSRCETQTETSDKTSLADNLNSDKEITLGSDKENEKLKAKSKIYTEKLIENEEQLYERKKNAKREGNKLINLKSNNKEEKLNKKDKTKTTKEEAKYQQNIIEKSDKIQKEKPRIKEDRKQIVLDKKEGKEKSDYSEKYNHKEKSGYSEKYNHKEKIYEEKQSRSLHKEDLNKITNIKNQVKDEIYQKRQRKPLNKEEQEQEIYEKRRTELESSKTKYRSSEKINDKDKNNKKRSHKEEIKLIKEDKGIIKHKNTNLSKEKIYQEHQLKSLKTEESQDQIRKAKDHNKDKEKRIRQREPIGFREVEVKESNQTKPIGFREVEVKERNQTKPIGFREVEVKEANQTKPIGFREVEVKERKESGQDKRIRQREPIFREVEVKEGRESDQDSSSGPTSINSRILKSEPIYIHSEKSDILHNSCISYDENILFGNSGNQYEKTVENYYRKAREEKPKTIRGAACYKDSSGFFSGKPQSLPSFSSPPVLAYDSDSSLSDYYPKYYEPRKRQFESDTNIDEIKLSNENISKESRSLYDEVKGSKSSTGSLIKIDISTHSTLQDFNNHQKSRENTKSSAENKTSIKVSGELYSVVQKQNENLNQNVQEQVAEEDFKTIVSVDGKDVNSSINTSSSSSSTSSNSNSPKEAKKHSHNYLKEFLESQKGSKKPLQNFISKKISRAFGENKRKEKIIQNNTSNINNLAENQFHSLPDITASKNLRKCEKIDRKLRKCDKVNLTKTNLTTSSQDLNANRFIVNIGRHFDVTAQSNIPVDFEVKISKIPSSTTKGKKGKLTKTLSCDFQEISYYKGQNKREISIGNWKEKSKKVSEKEKYFASSNITKEDKLKNNNNINKGSEEEHIQDDNLTNVKLKDAKVKNAKAKIAELKGEDTKRKSFKERFYKNITNSNKEKKDKDKLKQQNNSEREKTFLEAVKSLKTTLQHGWDENHNSTTTQTATNTELNENDKTIKRQRQKQEQEQEESFYNQVSDNEKENSLIKEYSDCELESLNSQKLSLNSLNSSIHNQDNLIEELETQIMDTQNLCKEYQEKLDSMRNYWGKMASPEEQEKEKEANYEKEDHEKEKCKIVEVQTKVGDVKKMFENCGLEKSSIIVEEKPNIVQINKQIFEPKPLAQEKPGRLSPLVKETMDLFENPYGYNNNNNLMKTSSSVDSGNETGERVKERIASPIKSKTKFAKINHKLVSKSKSVTEDPEFDHVRYRVVKSDLFQKKIFANCEKESQFDGLMQYLQDFSFQELLIDNNIVIIEPIRTNVPHPGHEDVKHKNKTTSNKNSRLITQIIPNSVNVSPNNAVKRHFFYHPIRVNREVNDDELPNPDTVKQVRQFFENGKRSKSSDQLDDIGGYKHVEDPDKDRCSTTETSSNSTYSEFGSSDNLFDGCTNESCCEQYVSEDVLEKIRERGTCITYYGGKISSKRNNNDGVTQAIMEEIRSSCNCNKNSKNDLNPDLSQKDLYQGVKFKLLKSNSCSSRLELVGTKNLSEYRNKFLAKQKEALAKSQNSNNNNNLSNKEKKEGENIRLSPKIIEEIPKKLTQWSEANENEKLDVINYNSSAAKTPLNFTNDYQHYGQISSKNNNAFDMVFEPYEVA